MRQLRLEKPPIRGTDVMDWQTFLINQGLLTDVADGIFGPSTAKASRDYQTNVGIQTASLARLRWPAPWTAA